MGRDTARHALGKTIESAIHAGYWQKAQRLIDRGLQGTPTSHWLIARLALTFYEQLDYARALELAEKARAISPNCPLVLWEYAGALQMLDRNLESIEAYEAIVARGVDELAFGQCGEGIARARRLRIDSHFRIAQNYLALDDRVNARRYVDLSLSEIRSERDSLYPKSLFEALRVKTSMT